MTLETRQKALLEARLADLQARLGAIEHELDAPHAQDWDDAAAEREGDEVLERLGQSGQAEIRMIHAALDRITRGDYGTCQGCGAPIAAGRLELLPATPLCTDCAGRQDRP